MLTFHNISSKLGWDYMAIEFDFSHASAVVQITLIAVKLHILLRFCALKMRASFNHLMY